MLVGGLIALDRRPILSGALFGLLSIKPQLGVLLPLMLALTGRWRTIFAAVITVALLLALTSLAFGPDVWAAYVKDAMPVQTKVFLRDYENFMVHMPTAFMNARVAGLSLPVAAWLPALLSLAAVMAVVWTFWHRRDVDLANALLVTATFLVTPYAFNYDMVVFGWVVIKLMDRGDNTAWTSTHARGLGDAIDNRAIGHCRAAPIVLPADAGVRRQAALATEGLARRRRKATTANRGAAIWPPESGIVRWLRCVKLHLDQRHLRHRAARRRRAAVAARAGRLAARRPALRLRLARLGIFSGFGVTGPSRILEAELVRAGLVLDRR